MYYGSNGENVRSIHEELVGGGNWFGLYVLDLERASRLGAGKLNSVWWNSERILGSMTNPECKFYEGCNAAMCPKDGAVANHIWYIDEGICPIRSVPDWVKKQRRLVKKYRDILKEGTNEAILKIGYFTVARLLSSSRVGENPDRPLNALARLDTETRETVIVSPRVKKVVSEKTRAALRAGLERYRKEKAAAAKVQQPKAGMKKGTKSRKSKSRAQPTKKKSR